MASQAEPVVVIGSGPIGAVAARRLAEAGRAVTILEAGPVISDPPVPTFATRSAISGTRIRSSPESPPK